MTQHGLISLAKTTERRILQDILLSPVSALLLDYDGSPMSPSYR